MLAEFKRKPVLVKEKYKFTESQDSITKQNVRVDTELGDSSLIITSQNNKVN